MLFITFNVSAQTDTLSVEDAIIIALKNNYGIQIEQKNVQISEVNNTWGNAGALPSITFVNNEKLTGQQLEDDPYSITTSNSSVELNWVIFRGFSARIQKDKLDAYQDLSQGTFDVLVENTIISVISAYYQVVLTAKTLNTTEELMELSDDRYVKEQSRLNIGNSSTYDVLQAKNSYLEDKSNYLNEKATYNVSVRQLNYLMGINLDSSFVYSDNIKIDTADFQIDSLESKMLSNNLTLKNQYLNLEMAKLDVKSSKSSYYPVLSLGAATAYNYSQSSLETATNYDYSYFNGNVSLTLSYSIYDGNQRRQALKAAQLSQEIALLQVEDYKYELIKELKQEFELYQIRKEMLSIAKDNYETAKLNFELSTKRFENGTINSFNYRDAQQMYLSSSITYQNAIYNILYSYNVLLRLTGGLIDAY